VETSPLTADSDKLRVLKERGVTRISIGVQSFIEAEARAAGRPQRTRDVVAALDQLRAAQFETLNIDLIYGLEGQTVETWLQSVEAALQWMPEEIYLYPLYVRPLTGLGKRNTDWDDHRLGCYRMGRDYLLAHGYEQISMRMFRLQSAPTNDGIAYCCQEDGMIGLGSGARSYTRALHYSSEYAVGHAGIRDILADYVQRSDEDFSRVDYGFHLDPEDQRRRYVIKSILRWDGLNIDDYQAVFGSNPLDDLVELRELTARAYLMQDDRWLRPTSLGLEYSDWVGPYLFSDSVRALSGAYELR
jgi:coproporphyrinogen III oxidase-like Fe-S oxidoreductase